MKKSSKIALLAVFLFLNVIYTSEFSVNDPSAEKIYSIRSSAPLGYTIHIDGNWSATESTYTWCSGSGTSGNPYVIQDIEIDANGEYGILIGNTTDYFRIENVTIYNHGNGEDNASLRIESSDNGHLYDNDFSDGGWYGVYMYDCEDFLIEYNNFSDNVRSGLSCDTSWNIDVQHNAFSRNGLYGVFLDETHSSEIWNNTFRGYGTTWYGLYLSGADNNDIHRNSLEDYSNAALGMVTDIGSNVTMNSFTNNKDGIWGLISSNADIVENNFTGGTGNAIYFGACDNMEVQGNRIIGNEIGLNVGINSDHNTLTENIFQDSGSHGVFISYGSGPNTDFHFFKNSFINNPIHAEDNGVDTEWNNTEYGNYWDDYAGSDTDGDGIGDTPYVVPPNITDYLPLTVANFSLLDDNDGDTLIDYSEIQGIQNPFGNEPTNPYNPDSDGDGLTDGEEVIGSTNPFGGAPTNPNENDTDGDGYTDAEEISGTSNTYDFASTNPNKMDTDEDGRNDSYEIPLGFNPNDEWDYPKADLVILSNYSLEGDVISITIKNVGLWKATGVTVVVNITSESLTMYDNTLAGFDLEVNETKEIQILKAEFRQDLVEGEQYFLSVYVDPLGVVNETSESNNSEEGILYTHNLSATGLTSLQLGLIIASSAILITGAAVASFLLLKRKKQKMEFRPLQLMVLEKYGSTLLFTHKFSKENAKGVKEGEDITQKIGESEKLLDPKNEELKKNTKKSKVKKERPKKNIDEILAAGAFSGIQSLLKSILQTEKGINEISHGEYTIYFNYGEKTICVMIAYGKFHRILSSLKMFSTTFEEDFQNEIAEFDGRVDVFSRAFLIVEKFLPK